MWSEEEGIRLQKEGEKDGRDKRSKRETTGTRRNKREGIGRKKKHRKEILKR